MRNFLIKSIFFIFVLIFGVFLVYEFDINLDVTRDKNVVFSLGDEFSEESILEYGANQLFADADFFKKAKDKLQIEKKDFIEADLSEMKLKVYKNGEVAVEVPIKTKGREGSWWETPSGIYKIQSKSENHFSSFGNVYQPYSLAFEGNFFIHGWPYYPSGEPVASTFSGGCIRLEDEHAKEVYKNSYVGMPVLVFEKDFAADDFEYALKVPEVSGTHYLVADLKSNFVLTEKNSFEKVYIGGLTKLFTALVAGEHINLDNNITVPLEAVSLASTSILKAGDTVTAYNLLFPLLMESSNEAAHTFANRLGENRYVNLMNEKAVAIGMNSTNFEDVTGESFENYSTPQDLFLLSKYLYNNRSFILKISGGQMKESIYGVSLFNNLLNKNLFVEDDSFIGGQISIDQVDELDEEKISGSMVAIFNLQFKGENRPVAFIVIGSHDIKADILSLKEYVGWFYI